MFGKNKKIIKQQIEEIKHLQEKATNFQEQIENLQKKVKKLEPDWKAGDYQAYEKKALLTNDEALFFKKLLTLDVIRNGTYLLNIKPTLKDLLNILIDKEVAPEKYEPTFKRINGKHFDFLLINPEDYMPVLAIELDGWNHEPICQESDNPRAISAKEKTAKSDKFKNTTCRIAELSLFRFKNRDTTEQIEMAIQLLLTENSDKQYPKCKAGFQLPRRHNKTSELFKSCSNWEVCRTL